MPLCRLFQQRLANGQNAKAVMLKANYRLVISIVKKYQGRGMTMQDLITEGMQVSTMASLLITTSQHCRQVVLAKPFISSLVCVGKG